MKNQHLIHLTKYKLKFFFLIFYSYIKKKTQLGAHLSKTLKKGKKGSEIKK
jgi:hypothetical protein